MTALKPFFVERIGGIPTVLRRGDDYNIQVAQHMTMKAAKAEAARRNLNTEHS